MPLTHSREGGLGLILKADNTNTSELIPGANWFPPTRLQSRARAAPYISPPAISHVTCLFLCSLLTVQQLHIPTPTTLFQPSAPRTIPQDDQHKPVSQRPPAAVFRLTKHRSPAATASASRRATTSSPPERSEATTTSGPV